ncbi:MAG: hypothetical protein FJ088_03730 [Deltaproteobacteria bacterium]|nr:hypothetical protein [Deltaproteobacteria bacterium]
MSPRDIPRTIPTELTDRILVAMTPICEMMIQLEAEFDHGLDPDRLYRAVRLALDAEPVLGCRFADDGRDPQWERLDDGALRKLFVSTGSTEEFEAFKNEEHDLLNGPQFRLCHLSASGGDRILLKVNHEAADAGGTKEIAGVISGIYSRLRDDPSYVPEPNLNGSRSYRQINEKIPLKAFPTVAANYLKECIRNNIPIKTRAMYMHPGKADRPSYIVRQIEGLDFWKMAAYGRARGATINDMLLAAFFTALRDLGRDGGDSCMRVVTTVDLRRYLAEKKGAGICNLSALEPYKLNRDHADDFETTLRKVVEMTGKRKSSWPGLAGFLLLSPILRIISYASLKKSIVKFVERGYSRHSLGSALTNMGPIPVSCVEFDKAPRRAWLYVPPARNPGFIMGISGFEEMITLTSGVYDTGTQYSMAVSFIEKMVGSIPISKQ